MAEDDGWDERDNHWGDEMADTAGSSHLWEAPPSPSVCEDVYLKLLRPPPPPLLKSCENTSDVLLQLHHWFTCFPLPPIGGANAHCCFIDSVTDSQFTNESPPLCIVRHLPPTASALLPADWLVADSSCPSTGS